MSVFVVFAPSQDVRAPDTGDPIAPSADEFAAAFAAFRARYPDVTTIAPGTSRTTATRAATRSARTRSWRPTTGCARSDLPDRVHAVAGDFAGIPGDDEYVDAYQAELAANGAVPDVWAFHAL